MPVGITTQGTFAMHAVPQIANPFALLTDPEAIFRAVEASPRLESLNRRICRPLDRAQRDGNADGQDSGPQDALMERESSSRFLA
jgi:hypothetical protein